MIGGERGGMSKNFSELRKKMPPERVARNAAAADRMLLVLTLRELRQDLAELSQDDVAELLKVTQGYVSRLERQADMRVSKLRAYVEALGGQIEIRAVFPGHEMFRIRLPQRETR